MTRRPRDDEGGYVILWMVIVLVLLLSTAAFAVDLVHAYVEGDRAQKAADAAALAGAVGIPTDHSPGHADSINRAISLAEANGFTPSGAITVTPTVTGANEMTVKVSSRIDTFFARIMGFDTLTVKRKAVAEYDPPASMGSAVNHLGDVPYCPAGISGTECENDPSPGPQLLWANIQGPDGSKIHGNAITTHPCVDSGPVVVDECSGNTNSEQDPAGETFKVSSDGTGPLDIWIYDPAFISTTPDCTTIDPADALKYATGTPGEQQAFAHYNDQTYCSGDTSYIPDAAQNPPVTTQYQVLNPDGSTACGPQTFNGFGLASGDGQPGITPGKRHMTAPDRAFDAGYGIYFHQWYKLCTIATPDTGEYDVNVQALTGIGNNQFSILALHGSSSPPDDLNVFAREQLPLLIANPIGGTSIFYVARVLPSNHQRDLQIDFFDLGDSSFGSSSGQLSITTTPVIGTFTPSCQSVPPPPTGSGSRALPFALGDFTQPGCDLTYDSNSTSTATWDGRWVSFHISIPPVGAANGYDCDSTDLGKCWIQLKITPAGGTKLSDATTWRAHLQGLPVRLVG